MLYNACALTPLATGGLNAQTRRGSCGLRFLLERDWVVPLTNATGLARIAMEEGVPSEAVWEVPACLLKTLLSAVREAANNDSSREPGGFTRAAQTAPAWLHEMVTEHLRSTIAILQVRCNTGPAHVLIMTFAQPFPVVQWLDC